MKPTNTTAHSAVRPISSTKPSTPLAIVMPKTSAEHHDRDRDQQRLRELGDQPPEHDRRARDRRRAQLVEVAALDLLDEEQRGGAERAGQQQRGGQLERAVALPVEELRRGRREDLAPPGRR